MRSTIPVTELSRYSATVALESSDWTILIRLSFPGLMESDSASEFSSRRTGVA